MRNLIKTSLVIGMLFTAVVVKAMNDEPMLKVVGVNDMLVHLSLENLDKSIEIYVKDNEGTVLHKELISESQFSKNFDLGALPNGSYYFEVVSLTKVKTIPFSVALKKVKLEEEKVFYKPVIRAKDAKIFISKLTLDKEDMVIKFYDTESNLLYKEKLKAGADFSLNRKLDVSKLEKGSYKLVLESEGKIVYETIKI